MKSIALLAVVALLGAPAMAQHAGHASPYAGQHSRDIKALSEDEVKGLLAGAGMGFAKAAELNRYPGPMHALELENELKLTQPQRDSLEALMQSHKAEARALGAEVVRLERELDALFSERRATDSLVDAKLADIALATAKVRGSHLKTHLATTALLDEGQVAAYVKLRGYGSSPAGHKHRH